jgi:hypothetical protein
MSTPPRWFAPVVVIVAPLADYLSPAEMWTAALPLMFMAVLLSFRHTAAALVVLMFSSWIFVPVAAGTIAGLCAARGTPHVYWVSHAGQLHGDVCHQPATGRVDIRITVGGTSSSRSGVWMGRIPQSTIEIDEGGFLASARANVASAFASYHNLFTSLSSGLECRPLDREEQGLARWSMSLR